MPAKTQDINQILASSKNLYEAVMVIASRARQINEEQYQKKRDRQILEELEGGFDDEFMQAELEEQEIKELGEDEENPINQALDDFLDNKLNYRYRDTEEQ
ncbi:MAG TPA: DNA-directed RNA polymerase subunit omega [Calditrichia bacterium]|nr:DNA-directed RNA polymerase subunit omega [Calditrichota bacterium]HQU72702.1 DNA-directed RNA polymerase subunit omega [Calditrichia bacterium]HQV34403.1 DNA-directed RNA polymerase subunit omega [Calditrichia bacterium]